MGITLPAFVDFPAHMKVDFGPYRARVLRVVDGDTIDAFVSFGFDEYRAPRVRIAGIDAPEKNRAATAVAGKAATVFLATLLPIGSPVVLHTDPDPDNFGRYIARVTMQDGRDAGDVMIANGHAVLYVR